MNKLDLVYQKMMEYYRGDAKRIQHFVKVHSLAALIGRLEGLSEDVQQTLEAAAYVHDIGIKPALAKYGKSSGPYQEELGIEPARKMLSECGFNAETVERVGYLVGHHHTYDNIDGADYQILVEADFLVNLFEHGDTPDAARHALEHIFKTVAGKEICKTMFDL